MESRKGRGRGTEIEGDIEKALIAHGKELSAGYVVGWCAGGLYSGALWCVRDTRTAGKEGLLTQKRDLIELTQKAGRETNTRRTLSRSYFKLVVMRCTLRTGRKELVKAVQLGD